MSKIRYKLKRVVFKISPKLAEALGYDFALKAPNRTFLEGPVFDYLNNKFGTQDKSRKLLFIGIDKHNWHYHRHIDLQFHTIEIKPQNSVYGQSGLYVVGSATELHAHYPEDYFDVVIANGLIGFGLDSKIDFESLLGGASHVLKPEGVFILGYNDRPDRLKFDIRSAANYELFEEFVPDIDGLDSPSFRVDDAYYHTYVFMKNRPDSAAVMPTQLPNGKITIKAAKSGGKISNAFGILAKKNVHNVALSIDEIDNLTKVGWADKK